MNRNPDSVHPLNYVWSIIKLAFWHIIYIFPGRPEEWFHIITANEFAKLHWYESAIANYKKALKDSKSVRIYSMLGHCYSKIGRYDEAVEYYRKIYKKSKYHGDLFGLALAEYYMGNAERSYELIEELRVADKTMTSNQKEIVDDLEARIAILQRDRDQIKNNEMLNNAIETDPE